MMRISTKASISATNPASEEPIILLTNHSHPVGSTALLHCQINNVEQLLISWIRVSDYHIVSTGLSVFSSDRRYLVLHHPTSSVWTLIIKGVQEQDEGEYLCQAATSTGVRTIRYWLEVHRPRAAILGSREKHVTLGQSITITCELRDTVTEPEAVFWYHNQAMVNHVPGISVTTSMIGPDPDSLWVAPPNTTVSMLTIMKTKARHTGNYTCAPTLASSDTARLFVSQGTW